MQIYARDHVEVHPQKKKEVLYLEEVDDHDECEVDEGDEALPTCSSDEDFVLGEIGESSIYFSFCRGDFRRVQTY